jgi:F-type H+-transporting ATPase subunit epsilon
MRKFPLEIVTPERKVYGQDVEMIIARGGNGDLGILAGHVPMVTTLKIHHLRIKKDGGEQVIAVSGGFMEVGREKVTILAEAAELPEEIDFDRAQRAKERAERRLAEKDRGDIDTLRAEMALQRAINRLALAKRK